MVFDFYVTTLFNILNLINVIQIYLNISFRQQDELTNFSHRIEIELAIKNIILVLKQVENKVLIYY